MANPDWRDGRIYRTQRVLSEKRPIPGGISPDDFIEIQKYLKDIFEDISDQQRDRRTRNSENSKANSRN